MIAKIERAEAQPTAALLGRLSAALGLTLSELITRAENPAQTLTRASEQPEWTDPHSGYSRRLLSPSSGGALELIEVTLPGGAEVAYPAGSYAFLHHQIWVISGSLRFREGEVVHELESGDCLELGPPVDCAYVNVADRPCRYLVAVARKPRLSP
jgi:transcriptional regulator with XRE-family HTH domain